MGGYSECWWVGVGRGFSGTVPLLPGPVPPLTPWDPTHTPLVSRVGHSELKPRM